MPIRQIPIGRLWSTKEGVGETSGQTAGSHFGRASSSQTDPAEETSFLRSVRILSRGLQFHRSESSQVKSGPDVFADALVPWNALVPRNIFVPWNDFPGTPSFRRPALLAPGVFSFPNPAIVVP